MATRIELLADHPDLIPLLADWFYKEWGGRRPEDTLEKFTDRLRNRMNRDRLPLALVSFLEEEPIGSAVLKIREMETHPQYKYWLGSVFLLEEHRGQGFGTELVKAASEMATRFGVQTLYLYTRGNEPFYSRLGWQEIEKPIFRGRQVTIMKLNLKE